jgi:hypothetical protein
VSKAVADDSRAEVGIGVDLRTREPEHSIASVLQDPLALLEADGHGPSGPAGADPQALEGALAGAEKSTT